MIEVVIRDASFGVRPLPGGGKQINLLHEPSQTYYLIPLDAHAVEVLVERLQQVDEPVEPGEGS